MRNIGGYRGPQLSIVAENGELIPWNPQPSAPAKEHPEELFVDPGARTGFARFLPGHAGAIAWAALVMVASTMVYLLSL